MSRTFNTAPLDVQAELLPAWSTRVWHTSACRISGHVECTLGVTTPRPAVRVFNRCHLTVRYYRGVAGGSRTGQGMYADQAEGMARTAVRAELRNAVRLANADRGAREGRFEDGTPELDWEIDVAATPPSTAWWLY